MSNKITEVWVARRENYIQEREVKDSYTDVVFSNPRMAIKWYSNLDYCMYGENLENPDIRENAIKSLENHGNLRIYRKSDNSTVYFTRHTLI